MSDKDAAARAASENRDAAQDETVEATQADASGNAGTTADEVPDAPSVETLQVQLEQAEAKAAEYWEQLLRMRAEMDNLRKRTERELENAHKYALERFAQELLPVRDSLEMGLAASDSEGADVAHLKEGTELTLKMLTGVLEKFGIREHDPEGEKFDPDLHQAMSTQPSGEIEPGHVLTVYQKGYTLNDRLLRPALVIVSEAPGKDG